MKPASLISCLGLCLVLPACASAPRPAASAPTITSAPAPKASEEQTAPAQTKASDARAGDPLALTGALALPKVEITPAKQLRRSSRADLEAALAGLAHQKDLEAAKAYLVKRLGKPAWIEDGQKRTWVALTPEGCYRLVLLADGTADLDGAGKGQTLTLAPGATQNMCTGEITTGAKE
jgi:hypothetical protein